ncbi:MAG TPA: ribose-phosphate pyrophosphokinase [Caulobacterales bacterium]|nr:ribose-phosphate pyrophosphokinase [Caulobacterales bacterium]
MTRLVLAMPGNEKLAPLLAARVGAEMGALETRRFPDEESYVRVLSDVAGKDVDVLATLARPDPQFLSLVFAAATARERGARSVRLIAPYLAYMRQDKSFHEGEAVSSTHFARLLSQHFDALVTIDPHLHRRHSLAEIFSIPTRVEHAAPLLARWIKEHVSDALVIGPDGESEQWVSAVAHDAGAPHVVLEKRRLGDRQVEIFVPDLSAWRGRRPVLVDDIVSSGRTMIEAARQLPAQGLKRPICLVVHALFADASYDELRRLSDGVVSTDTVFHQSNVISVVDLLAGD